MIYNILIKHSFFNIGVFIEFQLEMFLLLINVRIRHGGALGKAMALGHQILLVSLSTSCCRGRCLVVLYDRTHILLVTNLFSIL